MAKTIYFEGLGLVDGHFSGIGQYIFGILRGLDELIERQKVAGEPALTVKVIIPFTTREKFKQFGFKHIQPKLFPLTFRTMMRMWHHNLLPPIDLYCGPGYYVFTRFVTMRLAYSKSAVIIYDLSFEFYRQFSDERNAIFLSHGTKRAIQQVDTVFTISQNAKKEIADFYHVPVSNILEATPAADQRYFYKRSESEIAKIKQKYDIKKDYILALSNLEPRKNLETLVDAYCALPESYRKTISLLLVGVSGWKTDKLFSKILKLVEEGYDIIRPSEYVSDKDKPAIISGAKMLVYPSHYEGFGMPPLEALACGVPVITADNSSLPEVVGSAGMMLDCNDQSGFAKAMENYLEKYEKVLTKARVDGPTKASDFSWEKSAKVYWDHFVEKLK